MKIETVIAFLIAFVVIGALVVLAKVLTLQQLVIVNAFLGGYALIKRWMTTNTQETE